MSPTKLTYAKVAPLVAAVEIRLASLYVTFRCPASGAEVLSTARIGEMTPVGGDARASGHDFARLEEGVGLGTRTMAGEATLPVFGAPHFELHGIAEAAALPEAILHHAIVRAFESVRARFKWDEAGGRFVAA